MEAAPLDPTDREILALLRQDSRRTLSDIAGRVTLSVAAVKRRIDRMQRDGVITGFTVRVDYAKLGWGVSPLVSLGYVMFAVTCIVLMRSAVPVAPAVMPQET